MKNLILPALFNGNDINTNPLVVKLKKKKKKKKVKPLLHHEKKKKLPHAPQNLKILFKQVIFQPSDFFKRSI